MSIQFRCNSCNNLQDRPGVDGGNNLQDRPGVDGGNNLQDRPGVDGAALCASYIHLREKPIIIL